LNLNFSNRPVRTRMPGGVAGAQFIRTAPYADVRGEGSTLRAVRVCRARCLLRVCLAAAAPGRRHFYREYRTMRRGPWCSRLVQCRVPWRKTCEMILPWLPAARGCLSVLQNLD